jgi:predicted metal-dependent HD superfamily phosphohydrolase
MKMDVELEQQGQTDLIEWIRVHMGEILSSAVEERCIADCATDLAACWSESHRVWHGPDHLKATVSAALRHPDAGQRPILALAALYHDAVYEIGGADNEERSAQLLLHHAERLGMSQATLVTEAVRVVTASRWSGQSMDRLIEAFFNIDCHQLANDISDEERRRYELAIAAEYSSLPKADYVKGRRQFLLHWAAWYPQHQEGTRRCLELLDEWAQIFGA